MSAMYNNFIFMYINLFQKGYLANVLARKTKYSCLEVVENISMDGRDQLEKFSKKFQKQENVT